MEDDDGIRFNPEGLRLGQRIYEVSYLNGDLLYYPHLNPDIMRSILYGEVSRMTVHFTSMKRTYFGAHSLGHVSGIRHCRMERSLGRAVWWDGPVGEGPAHRDEHPEYPDITFPLGHRLLATPDQ